MIELLMRNLQDTKKEILLKLSSKEQQRSMPDVSKLIDSLPEDVREKVLDLKRRMDDAMERKDTEALKKLREEIFNLKNPFKQKDDDDNFNINDFKGGMA
jgi:excinuclease UvrABC helicase subunit UvrB